MKSCLKKNCLYEVIFRRKEKAKLTVPFLKQEHVHVI